ncbi:uncharacterized protein LOC124899942 [Capsicum annuum]|uniref:uncharacterized protein LOC124899942 n=1 Tax=Capsicum annuum TaxID=4072 RepID=UPI001FB0F26D|nr:uncharacterized protein LOC124899942 [Capsicum annuum]XP_047270982.1 uncharacterized protein LOC124899942 [Capsicum annuum]XP_047270983.1 uncharacterized protein LOC124899942 [Capsicum annuum]XP_047270984.1 uncharacterized protein LOC124899942 [Capsicum annuum]
MNVSRIRRPSRYNDSSFTIKFGSADVSTEEQWKTFDQKHSFISHPVNAIEDTKVINKFMTWLSLDLLKYHSKRNSKEEHYLKGKAKISVINFEILSVEDKNWFYVMGTPSQTWSDEQIDVCLYYLRKKSKYDPNISNKFSTVDCNFMNIVTIVFDVYKLDDATLNAGGNKYHLNEYVSGFRMHATVPWHTVDHIFIPVHVKAKHHWVLAVISFNHRCIYVYNSLSAVGHDAAVLTEIEKLAKVIPICLIECKFYENKGIDIDNQPNYKLNYKMDPFGVSIVENVPQQPSGSL